MSDQFQRLVSAIAYPGDDTADVVSMLSKRVFVEIAKAASSRGTNHTAIGEMAAQFSLMVPEGESLWLPELAHAFLLTSKGRFDALTTQLALCAAVSGATVSFRTSIDVPVELYVAGAFMPVRGSISINADPDYIEVQAEKLNLQVARSPSSVYISKASSAVAKPISSGLAKFYAFGLDASRWDFDQIAWPSSTDVVSSSVISCGVSQLEEAMTGVHAASPKFETWIGLMVRLALIPAHPMECAGRFFTSSSPIAPATIVTALGLGSEIRRPWWILGAELVHESSHQYFNLVNTLFSFTQNGSGRVYYSALARRHRPAERTLAALHAAYNMAVFLEDVTRAYPRETRGCPYINEVRQHATELSASLASCTDFSRAGLLLYENLSMTI